MRQFGIISSTLWRSKRFRALSSLQVKTVYIYLHTSPHGNSAGAFILPPELAALDLNAPAEEVREAFEELRDVGLIRYDPDEQIVQIVGFFRFNSVKSRKHLAGPMRVIREVLPASPARDAAACEMVVDMVERARQWDADVDARAVFMSEAKRLIEELRLQALISSPEIGLSDTLLITLSDTLFITLPIQGEDQDQDQDHRDDTDKTKTKTKTTETAQKRLNGKSAPDPQGAPPSPPADGGRSGRSPPEDIGDEIKRMRQAAADGKRITKGAGR